MLFFEQVQFVLENSNVLKIGGSVGVFFVFYLTYVSKAGLIVLMQRTILCIEHSSVFDIENIFAHSVSFSVIFDAGPEASL